MARDINFCWKKNRNDGGECDVDLVTPFPISCAGLSARATDVSHRTSRGGGRRAGFRSSSSSVVRVGVKFDGRGMF